MKLGKIIIFFININHFFAAISEVISSGRLVPNAMIVSPISLSLIPAAFAMYVALFIVICPPRIIPASPTIRIRKHFQSGNFFSSVSAVSEDRVCVEKVMTCVMALK